MIVETIPRRITADDLLAMPDDGKRHELVAGELTELPPPILEHGGIQANVGRILGNFVIPRRLGMVFTEAGFLIDVDPDTVRAPDVAFISARRIPEGGLPAYFPGAPDIAIEVVSPSGSEPEALARALTWLEAGSAAVWTLYPDSRSAKVYRTMRNVVELGEDDVLDAAPVLDGFSVRVSDLFPFGG